MKEAIGASLLIVAMVVAAALYTNPPGIRCVRVEGQIECVKINTQ